MNATDKPRADARLKTLPEERQTQIAEFARTHSLVQIVRWLREAGLVTSISAVSKFLRWHRCRQQVARNEAALQAALADLIRHDPSPAAERLHETGNVLFAALALEQQDAHGWHFIQSAALRRAEHQLNLRKAFQFLPPSVPPCTLLYPSSERKQNNASTLQHTFTDL